MLVFAVVVALWGIALSAPHYDDWSYAPLSEEDMDFLSSLPSHRGSYPAGFMEGYVDLKTGTWHLGRKPSGNYLKVIGSPQSSVQALRLGAMDLYKMLRYSPPHIIANLVKHNAALGFFHRAEKLTIFPEYSRLRDRPECTGANRCSGSCAGTCTFDGRKWDTVTGITGSISLVVEENILCDHDPHGNRHSTTVHEFGHSVDRKGLTTSERSLKTGIYNNAKVKHTWRAGYAMANSQEFFAEATGSFFLVERESHPGGMNECYGVYRYCRTEQEVRAHIRGTDPALFDLLSYVYTSRRPRLPSELTICPDHSAVG